jgi:hypothetical protein
MVVHLISTFWKDLIARRATGRKLTELFLDKVDQVACPSSRGSNGSDSQVIESPHSGFGRHRHLRAIENNPLGISRLSHPPETLVSALSNPAKMSRQFTRRNTKHLRSNQTPKRKPLRPRNETLPPRLGTPSSPRRKDPRRNSRPRQPVHGRRKSVCRHNRSPTTLAHAV